jgi:CrcB protein
MTAVLVLVGGALGALSRYAASALSARLLGAGFPWGTLVVNVVGCFLIGIASGLMERSAFPRNLWPLAVTGFLGGFTTFSTFSIDSVLLFRDGATTKAIMNMALNGLGGLAACLCGLALALRATRAL